VIPASFGDLFYSLRGHIDFVRHNLLMHPKGEAATDVSAKPTGG